MKYLLDTCIISELVRPIPSPKVTGWINTHDEQDFYLSAITLGEIEKGVSKLADGKKKMQLQSWLADELMERIQWAHSQCYNKSCPPLGRHTRKFG